EQVLAESPLGDFLGQILVSGAEQPHVDGLLLLGADGAHRLLLDGPQQLDLHGQWQVGHLVKKKGAAAGRLEQARLVSHGAGKAALAMAEELAFHQLRRNGAAVDWHKGMAGPRSEGMDAPGNQFLAAAGLTTDIEGSLAAGELGDLPAQLLD